jgi:hypothetical protein
LNNDSDLEQNAAQLLPLADFYDRPDWRYIATGGLEGVRPEGSPSRVFPWAGHVVLRTEWGPTGDWAFFDCGPYGTDHQQRDRLHVSASLGGKNLLVDSGRYIYRDDAWSQYFRGPKAHNVPTFDRYQRVSPDPESFEPQESLADFSGDLRMASSWIPLRRGDSGPWSGSHARKVAIGPGFLWIVDRIDLADPDVATFRWHFHPDLELEKSTAGWVAVGNSGPAAQWTAASTVPLQAREIRGQEKGEIEGWYSTEYNKRVPNSVLIYRSSPASSGVFAWLLISVDAEIDQALLSVTNAGSHLELIRGGAHEEYSLELNNPTE